MRAPPGRDVHFFLLERNDSLDFFLARDVPSVGPGFLPSSMLFCPNCANVVTVLPSSSTGENKWTCPTCPYEFPMQLPVSSRMYLQRKQVDDVMGGEDSWKNVDSTEGTLAASLTPVTCPKCDNDRAYFMQLQIRSADEPSTCMPLTTSSDHLLQMHAHRMWPPVARKLRRARIAIDTLIIDTPCLAYKMGFMDPIQGATHVSPQRHRLACDRRVERHVFCRRCSPYAVS